MIRAAALTLLLGAVSPQDNPLQEALRDSDPEGPWHYNDPASGFAEATATGKPLLIVFR
jgi:hypothetical protein